MRLLDKKVALITGASRGIGAATALLFAKNGADVGVNFLHSNQKADKLVEEILQMGQKSIAIQADVTKEDDVKKMTQAVHESLGTIDILVINAHINFKMDSFINFKWEDFENKLLNELKAAFLCSKAVINDMIEKKSGSITILSSDLSRVPQDGFLAHSVAKSAIDGFVKSLACELGKYGVRVNAIAPGLTITDQTTNVPKQTKDFLASITPLRRNALPEDIAKAILMFSSDLSSFITGTYTPIDGGGYMN